MGLLDFITGKRKNAAVAASNAETMTQIQAEEIVCKFGRFLERGMPIIKDEALLPFSKARIMTAFSMQEQFICDVANSYIKEHRDQVPAEIDTYLENLRVCMAFLSEYAEIDSEDRLAVTRFNGYQRFRDVPDEQLEECARLQSKYGIRGMESEIPGYGEFVASSRTELMNAFAEEVKMRSKATDAGGLKDS
jgi:hypothetical protein